MIDPEPDFTENIICYLEVEAYPTDNIEDILTTNDFKTQEQLKDSDVQKNLQLQRTEMVKPSATEEMRAIQRTLLEQFSKLIIIENVLYRESQDHKSHKYVLPKQLVLPVVKVIH